jgi:MoaA/NifB/PqqE/SkfB family radical SAM enzyme
MSFKFIDIDEYQIEITSHCNAACPQCPRNNNGVGVNPYLPVQHLSRETIDNAFPQDLCERLRMIFFCGSHGDPIAHPNFLDILQDFRRKNPTLWLYIHTNAGIHNEDYWRDIATIFNGYGQIDFGIDGLEDTAHIYRKNVPFSKSMRNARAFIGAGGRAQWNFLVFKHNEHQVEDAIIMGAEFGFLNVLIRNTGRFFNHKDIVEMDHWPVEDKKAPYKIYPPTIEKFRNKSTQGLPHLRQDFESMDDYFNTTPIHCDAMHGKKVAINAEGIVLPCNFLNHNLYDHRFYDNMVLPGSYHLSTQNGKNQVRSFLEKYGMDNLNIKHRTLQQIFNMPMWDDLVRGWSCDIKSGRLFECAMTCGSKITKVWDQGGSN